MMTIGDRIRTIRQLRRITQVKLAELTGIHPVSIRKYETNKMRPLVPQVERIAEALQVSVNAIIGSAYSSRPITTVGDMMGLLIDWHKMGVMTIQGTRDNAGRLESKTMRLVPSPAFEQFLHIGIVKHNEKGMLLSWDGMVMLPRNPDAMYVLLEWEQSYHKVEMCLRTLESAEVGSEAYNCACINLEMEQDSLEYSELSMRSSNIPIADFNPDMEFKMFIQPLDTLKKKEAAGEPAASGEDAT